MPMHLHLLMAVFSLVLLAVFPVDAKVQTFGPFSVDDSRPNVISLDGDIDAGSVLNFRCAFAATRRNTSATRVPSGAYLGLTPARHQSGGITRRGDRL